MSSEIGRGVGRSWVGIRWWWHEAALERDVSARHRWIYRRLRCTSRFGASDTPTHKESNTRRLALGRLSRLEASGHQAEQFSIGVSTGEQQSDAPGIAQDDGPMRNSFRRSVPHCARASAVSV